MLPDVVPGAAAAEGFFIDMFLFTQRHPYQVCAVVVFIVTLLIVSSWLLGKQVTATTTNSTTS